MNIIQRYRLYKQMVTSVPELIERDNDPIRQVCVTKWQCNGKYSVCDVHDTKYDWHTIRIRNQQTNDLLAKFDGFIARRIFNHIQKSM